MDHEAVLFANEAFYQAFAARDVAAMDGIWARHCQVACIHPGWGPLFGRDAVMTSWRGILGSQASPAIVCRDARPFIYGDVAFVTCFEEIDDNFLIATNVYVRHGAVWKLVHHQAGPTAERPTEQPSDESESRPN
jgi:hypothetical protein